ncbi:MAG: CCA tRNA nucleotidyltransferase [Phycisphaerae bacterium]
MPPRHAFAAPLPPAAEPAVLVARRLRDAGHEALLAGGCVRDLLRGATPTDYDVATDATPQRVSQLFRPTRQVGAAFGVVLVRSAGQWIEVATFRSDGNYADGRRPTTVTFTDAARDAQRRDFTINGMFLDPLAGEVIDYVGGRADLEARVLRCIGDADTRFDEDYLRLLRAVRFAARLNLTIEPTTHAAIGRHAPRLREIAAERVRDELEKMLDAPSRGESVRLLIETRLIEHLWHGASWSDDALAQLQALTWGLGEDARFEATMSIFLAATPTQVDRVCRSLACSNEQRELIDWLTQHHSDLDDVSRLTLAAFKRLLAHRGYTQLRTIAIARYAGNADRLAALDFRAASIAPDAIAPPPLVTGQDLIDRNVAAGPIFKQLLDALYTEQLDEQLASRDAALARLDQLLAQRR